MAYRSDLKGFGRGGGLFNERYNLEVPGSRRKHHLNGASVMHPDPKSGFYKLHVKSIPLEWNKNTLVKAFQTVGKVMSVFMSTPVPGATHKWAFIEYENWQEAEAALEHCHLNPKFDNIEVSPAEKKKFLVEVVDDQFEDSNPMFTSKPQKLQRSPADISALCDIKITVKNEKLIRCNYDMSGVQVSTEINNRLKHAEDSLYLGIMDVLNNSEVTPKSRCHICGAPTSLGCADCTTTPYCTVDCQAKDTSHFLYCRILSDSDSTSDLYEAGNHRQGIRNVNKSRDEKPQQLQNRFDEKPQRNRRETSQNRSDNNFNNKQSDSKPPRNLFEDRKSRFNSKGANSIERKDDRPMGRGEQTNRCDRMKQDDSNLNGSNLNSTDDNNCDTSEMIPELKPEIKEPIPELKPGIKEAITIWYREPACKNVCYMSLNKLLSQVDMMQKKLDDPNASRTLAKNPAIGDICLAQYEQSWCRVRVTCLSPLTVHYIDFGNSEEITPNQLFAIPADLMSTPPFAIKIKFAAGTPNEFLEDKNQVTVIPIRQEDDHWVVQVEGIQYPETEVRSQPPKQVAATPAAKISEVKNEAVPAKYQLNTGEKEVVIISYNDPASKSVYCINLKRLSSEINMINIQLNDDNESYSPANNPAVGDICIAKFEDMWSRVQVTCLNPLTVKYIDFGNLEKTTTNDLYNIPGDLVSTPPLAIKIKLADGTPNEFLEKEDGDFLTIIPIEQLDEHWVVQIDGIQYPTTGVLPEPVTPTPAAQVAFPTLLPGTKFTEVYVVHRDPNYVSVTPMERKMELFELKNILQDAAVTALPIKTPKEKDKCIAKWSNIWYRGRIISLEPLRVLFVDNGNTEVCSSENIKELPAQINKKYSPFAIRINTKDMKLDTEIIKKDHFSVKPLYKDSDRGLWVVDVAAVVEATPAPQPPAPSETVVTLPSPCATSQPKTNHFSCSFLPEGTFSTVTIVHQNLQARDKYFVGPTNILEMHNNMNKHFAQMTASGSQLMTPKIGEIGICKFEGIWYRVKVESLAPVLTVFYMDFGNTDPTTAEELRECPESHKNIPALVQQIKLGTGISEKYFNLEPFSSISIKPVSSLDDGTIVVHVEGETYNAMPNEAEVSKPLSPASESKLSQMVSPVSKTVPVQSQHIVQLMQQGWTAVFEPKRIDYATNTLVGSLYSDHLPKTKDLLSLDKCVAFKSDGPDTLCFKPDIGEVVACQENQKFKRGKVLEDGRVVLVDLGRTAKPTIYRRLPAEFASVPYLAASLSNLDMDLLNQLSERNAFTVTVSAVTQSVRVTIDDYSVEAELQGWQYNPLTCPDTLISGDQVTITEVVFSNSLIVMRADTFKPIQTIQVECIKSGNLKSPPKIGDYVGYQVKEYSYQRSLVVKTDSEKDEYELYNIDYGTRKVTDLKNLWCLTDALCKLPCLATRINLKDVDKVDKMDMTEESLDYLNSIRDKILRIEFHSDNTATLVIGENKESVNEILADLLKPKIISDINGKLTLMSLTEIVPPLHQQLDVVVTQTEPLYVQIKDHAKTYYTERVDKIQFHCNNIKEPYRPCQYELCFAKYEDGDWYRAFCIEEGTDLTLMLVDFGNIFYASTREIRKMDHEFLDFPVLGLPCRISGLPTELSHEQKVKLEQLLPINEVLKVTFESKEQDYNYISIPSVLSSLLS